MALAWLIVMAQVQDHPQLFPLTIKWLYSNPSPSLVIPVLSIPPPNSKGLWVTNRFSCYSPRQPVFSGECLSKPRVLGSFTYVYNIYDAVRAVSSKNLLGCNPAL